MYLLLYIIGKSTISFTILTYFALWSFHISALPVHPSLYEALLLHIATTASLLHSHSYQSHVGSLQLHIMAPDWSFNLLDFPRLSIQRPSGVKSSSLSVVSTSISRHQVGRTASSPRRTSVGPPAVTYGPLHLLGLPGEVRLAIWGAIHYDILLGSEELWFKKPSTAWDGLQLTCRQIQIEIADFWPCTIIPQAKVDKAFSQVLSIELLSNFRRLSLELPFNKGRGFFESLAFLICGLAPVLDDLRLFFIGQDKFNIKTFVHGCGSRCPSKETSSTKLTVEGQYQHELQPMFFALYFLERLRTLVVNNANYPLLQSMIIKHKLQLEHLHISTDPRSILHTEHDLEGKQQLLLPPREDYPPVKILHISTNAAITALQVAAKVSRTLEEVNWTLPDVSHQRDTWNWLEQTTVLLDHFGTYASNLRTMRICLHAQLYEAHHSEASLIGGLKDHLPRLTSLETLELHIDSRADFSGQEIIFAIPGSLKRLYVSDKLISVQKLENLITKRYLWSKSRIEQVNPFDGWTLETLVINDNGGRPVASQNEASQNAVFVPRIVKRHDTTREGHWRKRNRKWVFVRTNEIIGEIRTRTDHIPYRHGKLGFIGYEYDGHGEGCECDNCDEAKLIMLRLNGRLLDRERNNHLVCFDGGLQISPRSHGHTGTKNPEDTETTGPKPLDDETARKIQELEKDVIELAKEDEKEIAQSGETGKGSRPDAEDDVSKKFWREQIEVRKKEFTMEQFMRLELEEFERIMTSFDARKYGQNSRHYGYFGTEKQAVVHFEKEITVVKSEIPELKWPDDALVGEKEHWISEA
jgi:hypothetical protein